MFLKIFSAVLLLGVVIFVHELGHFILARIFKVKVFVFSLGFGKPLITFKKGETEYRISAFPLGGYVRMLGEGFQEVEIAPEDIPRSFSHKKWWQKSLIVLAGPMGNMALAVFLYFIISFSLYQTISPVVEMIFPNTPAAKFLIEGDKIIELDNKKIHIWEDIIGAMPKPINGVCPAVNFKIKKYATDITKNLLITPEAKTYKDLFGITKKSCQIGIFYKPRDTRVAFTRPIGSLRNGDKILKVNKKEINRFYKLKKEIKSGSRSLLVERDGKTFEVNLSEEESSIFNNSVFHGGTALSKVEKQSISHKIGLLAKDFVDKVNGKKITSPLEFRRILLAMQEGDSVSLSIFREGMPLEKSFDLKKETTDNKYTGMKDTTIKWGGNFYYDNSLDPELADRQNPILFSLTYPITHTWKMTSYTLRTIYYLITLKLPAKSVGGPIMVFDIASEATERGLLTFLAVMALISINLGLINLLPIPILDGGHMMMYTVEGVTGRKINPRAKEIMMGTGFFLLIGIMLFAIFNDITRYIPGF